MLHDQDGKSDTCPACGEGRLKLMAVDVSEAYRAYVEVVDGEIVAVYGGKNVWVDGGGYYLKCGACGWSVGDADWPEGVEVGWI